MAGMASLFTYLQAEPDPLETSREGQGKSYTTSRHFTFPDEVDEVIKDINHWQNFNLQTIKAHYDQVLSNAQIALEPFLQETPIEVRYEIQLRYCFYEAIMPRVRHALGCAFNFFDGQLESQGLTPTFIGGGIQAKQAGRGFPDLAFLVDDPTSTLLPGTCRLPGNYKLSLHWHTEFWKSDKESDKQQFKQVISHVLHYMKAHHTRYGFVITDAELVPFRRSDLDGVIDMADPIPWNSGMPRYAPTGNPGSTSSTQRLTILLALWYLGMLAAEDSGWHMNLAGPGSETWHPVTIASNDCEAEKAMSR